MLKKLYSDYKPFFKGVLTSIGIIAIFDWVIAPGLTVPNTIINVLSLILGSFMILIFGLLVWENIFKNNKKEESWQKHSETTGPTSNEDSENEKNKDNENLSN